MKQQTNGKAGYVYILEVKDIDLPVCKIGMTTKTPSVRCAEINRSSTGDFIWTLAYKMAVNDCRKFESLVHEKLVSYRQKGREFFNIGAETAHKAMISILDNQTEIQRIDEKDLKAMDMKMDEGMEKNAKPRVRQYSFRKNSAKFADLLHLFCHVLKIKGRPFGQLNRPVFGISDGKHGVQWNLAINSISEEVKIGVNLEGSEKTGRWLIAPFILNRPRMEGLKAMLAQPDRIMLKIARDAWQGASRLNIKEKYIGGREYWLSEVDENLWLSMLQEALGCLDETKSYLGRKRGQSVTLESNGRKVVKDISPHLTLSIFVDIEGDVEQEMRNRIADMQTVYDWVVQATC